MSTNLIVVFGDEMRAHAMGCSGNPDVRTPNMDRMAAEGLRFTRAFSNTPVCTPARGTMLTGLVPADHGAIVNDVSVRTDVPSIAHALGCESYRCGYIGKWHLGAVPRDRRIKPGPERLGFDDYWAAWNCHHNYFEPKYFLNDEEEPTNVEGYEPTVQTDLALGFLNEHADTGADDPFCLFLSWGPPHDPYTPWPPGSEGSYDPAKLTLRENCPDTPKHREDLVGYYAHTTALDIELGRILDLVRSREELADTLVVFTGDHGSMLGSHGVYHKQWPWAESVNVPMIFWGPEWLPKGESGLVFSLLDFAPTLLGALGAEVPERMQGIDLSPQILTGEPHPHPVAFLFEQFCFDQAEGQGLLPWRGVKTERYTYAVNTEGPWVLYDDREDPFQLANLVNEATIEPVRRALDEELHAFLARFNDRVMPREQALDHFGIREAWNERQLYFRDREAWNERYGNR